MKNSKHFLFMAVAVFLFIAGCKKDKKDPLVAPSVITAAMTDLTTTTATAGGAISSDGGATVTEAGVYYSLTNNQPVSTDSKMVSTSTSGTFSINLTGLRAGSTYYLRAYAINSIGTGYGEVMTFMTGNAAPEAKNVTISGELRSGAELTAAYTYFDNESNAEGVSTYQWYIANDTIGAEVTPITGATAKTYTLGTTDETKFIKVGVTPKATSGTTDGAEVKSKWYGPVGGETVTFSYNGHTVTYGVIKSSVTGRKWMDRNLGAPNTPSSWDDYANYGDLFQWGRGDDGHQLVIRDATTNSTTSVNDISMMLSSNDNPNDKRFIKAPSSPGDWRNPQNDNLWQGSNGINNPCPTGWHVPTKVEWKSEAIDNSLLTVAYAQLKITAGGYRNNGDGSIYYNCSSFGAYWSSTVEPIQFGSVNVPGAYSVYFNPYETSPDRSNVRGIGHAVRCIKDN